MNGASTNLRRWTAPVRHRCAKLAAVECNELEGAAHHRDYHDRPRRGQDGLFTNGKFCLTRQGRLALLQHCGRSCRADRPLSKPGSTVSRGSCPSRADHEATVLDGGAALGQSRRRRAAMGSGLSAALVGANRRSGRPSCGHTGKEPPCTSPFTPGLSNCAFPVKRPPSPVCPF